MWDADRDRRQKVAWIIEEADVHPQIVETDHVEASLCRGLFGWLAVVAMGTGTAPHSLGVDVIQELKRRGFQVVAYDDGVDAWPIRQRCRPLWAGATELLDSRNAGFSGLLRQILKQLIEAEGRRRAEDGEIQKVMRRLEMIGESPSIIEVVRRAVRVSALSDLAVLITGETGTGKERMARAIHQLDPKRNQHPFVAVNCGAISPHLAESELFGHRRGAFTGADRDRKGLFRSAQGGVIFLDEIGELNEIIQAKLLRVLQENQILGVGEERETPINVRVVAATNRDLREMVEARRFRSDLFHRLNVLTIHITSLRERPMDVLPLVEFFLKKYQALAPVGQLVADPEVVEALRQLELPGNVRQLENLIRQALVNKQTDSALHLSDLPPEVWRQLSSETQKVSDPANEIFATSEAGNATTGSARLERLPHLSGLLDSNGGSLSRLLQWCERALVEAALQRTNGNQSETARLLGISPRSVYNKLRKHRLR